jgi:prevent-host-death family protein
MQEIAISEFKAKCLALLEEVHKTKQPIRITRHGKPIAEVVPSSPARKRRKLGSMAGTVKILGDIVSPVIDLDEFEANRD